MLKYKETKQKQKIIFYVKTKWLLYIAFSSCMCKNRYLFFRRARQKLIKYKEK